LQASGPNEEKVAVPGFGAEQGFLLGIGRQNRYDRPLQGGNRDVMDELAAPANPPRPAKVKMARKIHPIPRGIHVVMTAWTYLLAVDCFQKGLQAELQGYRL
jgi:hypothetical protein